MSTANYVLGTIEYLMLEVACTTPGVTFTPADWTAEVALVAVGDDFDDGTADWNNATLETVDSVYYAKVLLGTGGIVVGAGKYHAYVRLTKTSGGTEVPLLKALGSVVVES